MDNPAAWRIHVMNTCVVASGQLQTKHSVQWRTTLLVWAVICAITLAVRWNSILTVQWPDPDDTMRMLEVRDWLSGQGWFDVTQYRLNPPQGLQMHWSRLVDIPIAAVVLLLTPLLGQTNAELGAAIIVPLFTLLILMRIIGNVTAQQFGAHAALITTILVAVTVPVIQQLQPLRVDHHGWQLVCAGLALQGMLSPRANTGGLLAGSALAFWLTISLEALPFVAACVGISCLVWTFTNTEKNEGERMTHIVSSLAVVAGLLYAATRAPLGWTTYCDALSPLHVALFSVATIGIIVTRTAFKSPMARLGSLGITALLCIAAVLIVAPQCSGGVFANLDPIVRFYWYDNVTEGLPVWEKDLPDLLHSLATPFLGLVGLFGLWWTKRPNYRVLIIVSALLISSTLVGIMVQRATGVASLMAMPSASWLILNCLRKARSVKSPALRITATVASCLLLMPTLLLAEMLPGNPTTNTAFTRLSNSHMRCVNRPMMQKLESVIQDDGHGVKVMAPLDISPAIVESTKLTAVASGYHRNQEAIRDVILAFVSKPSIAKQIVQKYDVYYFLYCPNLAEMLVYQNSNESGLIANLESGSAPIWLLPIKDKRLDGIKLYRVDKTQD